MGETVWMGIADLRDAAIVLNDFETSLGAIMLTDALESMLSGKARPAEGLSRALREDKKAQAVLKQSEANFSGYIAFDWQKMRIADDVQKAGVEKVIASLRQSAERKASDKEHEATMLRKAVELIDIGNASGAFDRQSFATLFSALELDRNTGKKISSTDQELIRSAALSALTKLTPGMRAQIRAGSAGSPLSKLLQKKLTRNWRWKFEKLAVLIPFSKSSTSPDYTPSAPPLHNMLRFNLHNVECLDDTDGGEPGRDEIELGGASGSSNEDSPQGASVGVFGPYSVGSFSSGDSHPFVTPLVLDNWWLPNLQYPHTFVVNLLMSERDSNDKFRDILEDFSASVAANMSVLITALSVAAGAAIGAGIGGAIGTSIAPVIGSIIGSLLGALVGLIGAWFSNAVNPEVFENILVMSVHLETPDHFLDGSTSTQSETLVYLDHGAHYEVLCNFTLHQ